MFYITIKYTVLDFFKFKTYDQKKKQLIDLIDSINPELKEKIQDYDIGQLESWAMFHKTEPEHLGKRIDYWYKSINSHINTLQAVSLGKNFLLTKEQVKRLLNDKTLFSLISVNHYKKLK